MDQNGHLIPSALEKINSLKQSYLKSKQNKQLKQTILNEYDEEMSDILIPEINERFNQLQPSNITENSIPLIFIDGNTDKNYFRKCKSLLQLAIKNPQLEYQSDWGGQFIQPSCQLNLNLLYKNKLSNDSHLIG